MFFRRLFPVILACTLAVPAAPAPAVGVEAGIVIEKVEKGRGGDRAGLRPGDVLTAWTRPAAAGEAAPVGGILATPGDLAEMEDVQAPLGPVTFSVQRKDERLPITIPSGEFGLVARPSMSSAVLDRYERGRARAPREERAAAWGEAAAEARVRQEIAAAFWLLLEAGRVWAEAGQRGPAEVALDEAVALAADDRPLRIQAHRARGRALPDVGAFDEAAKARQDALRLREAQEPDGLVAAAGLEELGHLAWLRSDVPTADGFYTRALRIRESRAPGTLVHARSLRLVANVHWVRSELGTAEALCQRALDFTRAHEPEGRTAALVFLNLANIALNRGRPGEAAELYRRVIALREPVGPLSVEVCAGRSNLGLIALNRGDLETADQMFEAAYKCFDEARLGAQSLSLLGTLHHRGLIAAERGELAAARQLFERALEVAETIQPGGASFTLRYLGSVALEEGDTAAARGYFERALAIEEKNYGPESVWCAAGLVMLGEVATREGDLEAARAYLERSLAIHHKIAPEDLPAAQSLQALGKVAEAVRQEPRARELYQSALEIRKRLAPGTSMEAESLHSLGRLLRKQGRLPEAAVLLRQAVEALDSHAMRIGGTQEARSSFRARHGEVYRDLLVTALEMGRVEEAVHVLERSRGRVLLEWLARRDLSFSRDVPPPLLREVEEIGSEYERVQAKLHELNPTKDSEEVDRLVGSLRDLQRQRGQWARRVREESPHYAALRYPEPLDATGVARTLDPGTVLLSYVVGPDQTHLFVIGGPGPAPVAVHVLPVGADALRKRVAAFRALIRRALPSEAAAVRAEGRALFDLLLGPAQPRIAGAERILICPDGPLHLLPFAALARRDGYLVEWKPLHVASSATVYAELRRSRTAAAVRPWRLVAFGDPQPHPRYARNLPPLRASRREIASLERLFPSRARAYLGAAATEGRAKALGAEVSHVHFASHARLNERFPLDSALMLSPGPGDENGLLQAWEIFEKVRLNADLVTLSACETALGAEMGGEGLVGLTRAFLYAGARSVLASLWSVSDKTTAELMARFYRHLASGKRKDEALRAAQIEMIRTGGRRAHPFRWAPFQLFGDWR